MGYILYSSKIYDFYGFYKRVRLSIVENVKKLWM